MLIIYEVPIELIGEMVIRVTNFQEQQNIVNHVQISVYILMLILSISY